MLDPVELLCKLDGLPLPVKEFRFDTKRRFRFDYAWVSNLLAVEVNGGVWVRGRHTRGAGYLRDLEKLNLAQIQGWIVLQTTPQTVHLLSPFLKQVLSL